MTRNIIIIFLIFNIKSLIFVSLSLSVLNIIHSINIHININDVNKKINLKNLQ